MSQKNLIIYDGPSLLDGKPIVAIATGFDDKSDNEKTGDMIQIWIMRRDIDPILAQRLGEDSSICGDCKHRDFGSCYVNIGKSPLAIFRAFHRRSYDYYSDDIGNPFTNKMVRIGAYGDPTAVPLAIWKDIIDVAKGVTAYTHQWKTCDPEYKNFCMASVDSIKGYMKEYHEAIAMGWRTFRIREDEDNILMENEFACPASEESGKKTTCNKCGTCSGACPVAKNPAIIFHNNGVNDYRRERYIKGMKKLKNKKKYRVNWKQRIKEFKELCKI